MIPKKAPAAKKTQSKAAPPVPPSSSTDVFDFEDEAPPKVLVFYHIYTSYIQMYIILMYLQMQAAKKAPAPKKAAVTKTVPAKKAAPKKKKGRMQTRRSCVLPPPRQYDLQSDSD